ncbi:cache domain-containing protein [Thioflexithrix psekupsensis]|uniref:HAMP domain-containing protein n=1 Tax=Thioflexithrix psekupsensis TaxID=1570016 RepID=A0A251X815_9GAMM|nr:cache domain-containing protein [Thioflexithrix psekupsensis]OUD14080.1 hypothetical protein TPSD3_07000 [Thioflexithrix psekupsensis]
MRIRQRLIINWVIVILLTALIIGSTSIFITYRALQKNHLSELDNITKSIRITTDATIDISVQNYLRAISESNLDMVRYYYQKYQDNLLTETEAKQKVADVLLSHRIGKIGYNFVYNISQAPQHVICEIHPKVPNLDVAQYDFGQTAFALKNGYFEYEWQNPDEPAMSKKAMYVSYFEPWDWLVASSSYKQEFSYLINQQELKRKMSTITVGMKGYIFILDLAGNLILHPNLENKNVFNYQDDTGFYFIREIIKQKTGIVHYRWMDQGEPFFSEKIASLTYVPEMGWIVVASTYASDVFKPVLSLSYAIALTTAFILFLGIIAIIFLVNSLTKPLIKITDNSKKLAEGSDSEYFQEEILNRDDEVGDLARAFDVMIHKVALREINLKRAEQLLREANATLEDNVRKRTEQLELANQEIHSLNCQLRADNVRMTAELHVTKRLQEMLLPATEELAKLSNQLAIACFIQPAAEVGGDYYDILEYDGHIKIGIGDVTGHGLESSVVMLMLQTCVRTLLTCGINSSIQFLSILNRTIYGNLKRINSDKSLTLILLDYQSDGMLTISGQHEEVLVVRANGNVERIDTFNLGFFVGIEPDIAHFIDDFSVQLESGDGIILYTDGLTEAFNPKNQQYGLDRLQEIVSQLWVKDVEHIKQAIIDDLYRHLSGKTLMDDVTLLVLKRR